MSNPTPDQVTITQRGALKKDDNGASTGWTYKNITTQTTTLVKSGAGILHSITFNKPIATGTVEIDDALTNTTPIIGTITTPTGPFPVTLIYDVAFSTGLSITTAVAAQDITVAYI
jgi:hypothetical protein